MAPLAHTDEHKARLNAHLQVSVGCVIVATKLGVQAGLEHGAADALPCELQDLLPSDFRYKLLVFTGDLNDALQQERIESTVKGLQKPEIFLAKYASKESSNSRFDIIAISKGNKEEFDFLQVPSLLRSHWSK